VHCWAAMKVGGPAWTDYHLAGIYPMSVLTGRAVAAYTDALLDANGITT